MEAHTMVGSLTRTPVSELTAGPEMVQYNSVRRLAGNCVAASGPPASGDTDVDTI